MKHLKQFYKEITGQKRAFGDTIMEACFLRGSWGAIRELFTIRILWRCVFTREKDSYDRK